MTQFASPQPDAGIPAYQPLPSDRPVRFGVLATGKIARKVTSDLLMLPDEVAVTAVGSRSLDAARDFADTFSIPHAYGSYRELAESDEVDVVYVTTPHNHHAAAAIACLDAGKHVLCEKPLTPSAEETERVIDAARRNNRFLMEAVWMRCNPLIRHARELIDNGTLGDIRYVEASFGFRFDGPDTDRLVNPQLAGGAILDLGVYTAHFVHSLLGRPDSIEASGTWMHTGVDGTSAAQLHFDANEHRPAVEAHLMCSLEVTPKTQAMVVGSLGRLEFDHFVRPLLMRLVNTEKAPATTEEMITAAPGNGYTFQAQEVVRCLRAGLLETPLVPLSATMDVAHLLHEWRARVDATAGGTTTR